MSNHITLAADEERVIFGLEPETAISATVWIWTYLHFSLSLVALALSGGVIFAYARLLPRERGMVRFFAASQVLIFGAYSARAVFWAGRSFWRLWVGEPNYLPSLWFTTINLPLNAIVVLACYCSLQAVWRMIPASERGQWSWISAPLYPPWSLINMIRFKVMPSVCDRRGRGAPDNKNRKRVDD